MADKLGHDAEMLAAYEGKAEIADIPVAEHHRHAVAGHPDEAWVYITCGVDDEPVHPAAQKGLNQMLLQLRVVLAVHNQGHIARFQQGMSHPANHAGAEGTGNVGDHHADLHGVAASQGLSQGIGMIVGHPDYRFDAGTGVLAHHGELSVQKS